MDSLFGRLVLAVATVVACGGIATAAQQVKPTKQLLVKNPAPDGDMVKRILIFKSKEGPGSTNTIVGNPAADGATLHVNLASGGDQCFDLPAIGWAAIGTLGFRYKDFDGPGAGISVSIKKTPSGVFLIKAKLSGRVGPLNVVPQTGNASFDLNLKLGTGDEYCAGGATPSGATNTDKVYKVKDVPAPASCGVAACPPSS